MKSAADRRDRLYALLPAVYRSRDHEQGQPLRALLQVIAEQLNLVEDNIDGLYENWFIETCQDWVVPYLGDLIGCEPVPEAGGAGDDPVRAPARILSPRRDLAHTIAHRRRKGTLVLLERLARDAAGWPARAVEFQRSVAAALSVTPLCVPQPATLELRDAQALAALGGPFGRAAHTADVRRLGSHRRPGRNNLPNVGVFLWRLRAFAVTGTPAACLENVGAHWFSFSALGNDTPLFNAPRAPSDPDAPATPLELPTPILRRSFTEPTRIGDEWKPRAAARYYGSEPDSARGRSLAVWAPGWPRRDSPPGPIPRERVIPADLSDWHYLPPQDHIAVDPELGRIAFPVRQPPRNGVSVSYHYGFSAELGGGEYSRPLAQPAQAELLRVHGEEELRRALEPWHSRSGDSDLSEQPAHAVIEISDSGVYVLPIRIELAAGHTLQLRAAQRARPLIRLLDYHTARTDSLSIRGEAGSHFAIDGLLVAGRGLRVEGPLASIALRHCTLVPGWSLEPDCEPSRPSEPSLELIDSGACVVIEHSIVGSIQVNGEPGCADPIALRVSDSIVDATGSDCEGPKCEAIGAAGCERAHAVLRIARSTLIGRVAVHAVESADDTLFLGPLEVARRQFGCVRFCYLHPASRSPRRFQCQPELAEQAIERELRAAVAAGGSSADETEIREARLRERSRVRPRFTSLRYGRPGYAQLALDCAPEIRRGAEDESELGAFHDLYEPQREARLAARLDEYVPAAADASILFET